MKQFNLTDWQNGEPVVTRDGRKVSELHYFQTALFDKYNVLAVVDGNIEAFTIEGKFYSDCDKSSFDLFHPDPEVLPNIGDIVWVRNNENEDWICAQFMWKVDGYYRAAICNPFKESNGVNYKFLTTINPYSNESK